jgi:prophage DNA circulation protein
MNKNDLTEAVAAMNVVLTALLATLAGQTGTAAAQTRYLCGQLAFNGSAELNAGGTQFWVDLALCFEAAQSAGATFAAMDAVRAAAEALVVIGLPAVAVKNFSIRMALAEQARILAATTFTSRQDIDNYFDQINASFERAKLVAADNRDNVAYTLLIAIHGAVSNDLANRALPLARMVSYTFPTSLPSLAVAQRIYYDPSRNDELIAENRPIHPLFMPVTVNALSD